MKTHVPELAAERGLDHAPLAATRALEKDMRAAVIATGRSIELE